MTNRRKNSNKHKKHDRVVRALDDRLRLCGKYEYTDTNLEYGTGEIDNLALYRSAGGKLIALVFEVKGCDTLRGHKKAMRQLENHYNHIKDRFDGIKCFYVHGTGPYSKAEHCIHYSKPYLQWYDEQDHHDFLE